MNNKSLLFSFACLFALTSCKKPPALVNKDTGHPDKLDTVQVSVQEIDFRYFSSKSKITYQDQTEDQSATVNIRMKKDSVIWLSVNKVNIEGFRALITRDSIYIIDKLHDDYVVKDFQSLSQQFNFPITFDLLQAAILGNLPIKPRDRKGLLAKNYYILPQQTGNIRLENFIGIDNKKLEKVEMVEQPTNNSLTLNYGNFTPLEQYLYPYSTTANLNYVNGQQKVSTLITFECKKAELTTEELKFPFNVKKKYERK
jgi:hypothetical protein